MAVFVRHNNHSQLFRRIHVLLSLIEQNIDMPSPSRLIAWKIIKCIMKFESGVAKCKDKRRNNILHILSNSEERKGAETITNVLQILSKELKMNLLRDENKINKK